MAFLLGYGFHKFENNSVYPSYFDVVIVVAVGVLVAVIVAGELFGIFKNCI